MIHSGQLKGHRAVVVGSAASGRAACRLLHALGASVRWVDRDAKNLDQAARDLAEQSGWDVRLGEHKAEDFKGMDLVVLSPGVPVKKIIPLLSPMTRVVAELELASWFVSEPMVAITGTNGKSTTTTLIGHVLEFAGKKAFTGGNLGIPLSDYLIGKEQADVLVLEVSSFQLQNCSSFHPQVAILLNFSPNHLDFHEDIEEYLSSKLKVFAKQTEQDLAIVPLALREELEKRKAIRARRVFFIESARFQCPNLPGRHNAENIEAASLACRYFGISDEVFQQALLTYSPLPHRVERVGEFNGVLVVDDSKGTTVDAMRVAIEAMDRPVHLLAGGIFKGGDLVSLVPLLKDRVKSVVLFGGSRDIFEEAWRGAVEMVWVETIEAAVATAFQKAKPGEVILLSPATSSFDQFANYKERGKAFCRAAALAGVAGVAQ